METLGPEPVVVSQGRQFKNFVPLGTFLRRSPDLPTIRAAIAETMRTATAMSSPADHAKRVIRTEPVRMSDGVVHGVQLWIGPVDTAPPERPVVGTLKWDLTTGVATGTRDSLAICGVDPDTETTENRVFAQDVPKRALNPNETTVLARAIRCVPGVTDGNTWDFTDSEGRPVTSSYTSRNVIETAADGTEHVIARAMNWRSPRKHPAPMPNDLGQRILGGLAEPGTHRALVDLERWRLLKWIDEPCSFYNWQDGSVDRARVHPGDEALLESMREDRVNGPTSRILRLPGFGPDQWVPVHVTVSEVELAPGTRAGVVSLRLPTPQELDAAGAAHP